MKRLIAATIILAVILTGTAQASTLTGSKWVNNDGTIKFRSDHTYSTTVSWMKDGTWSKVRTDTYRLQPCTNCEDVIAKVRGGGDILKVFVSTDIVKFSRVG